MLNTILGLLICWFLYQIVIAIISNDKEPSEYDDDNGEWF